uniref:Alpha-1,6-mannosyl-glycoprotein 2-beta-N-acetylglucosaminyltransferase n=2 Tax=Strigamia maritima TaxID=126957 RepID=T1J8R2_STRMM
MCQTIVNLNMTSREGLNLSDIKLAIDSANAEEKIWNYAQFGPLEENDIVIVVQVHTRLLYLRHLISSLQKSKHIEKVLLIFSHDVYYPEINSVIQAIDFCKVLQIFYPFSIQLHPSSFPGQDPYDCPRDMKKEKAVNMKCNNANFPDLYGHYREAKFTQTKHHWWWKINHVFDGLRVTRNHTGLFLFLEEDHYVVEDFLHSLALLEKVQRRECKHCNVLSLGTYVKVVNYAADSGRAEIWQWISSKHNMGMAFNSATWKDIKSCAEKFCFFDDYNWDWSLQYISASCLQHKLIVMLVKAPRVYHIGECGVHHKKKDCASNSEINKVLRLSKAAVSHLYPTRLLATHSTKRMGKIPKGNGGWGDIRDRQLCMWHANITDIR